MSTGETVVARVAMKPLATLNRPTLKTVDTATKEATVSFKERTDVTAVPAMGVVAETMMALVLANEVTRKFGADSVGELVRNYEGFLIQVKEATARVTEAIDDLAPINWDGDEAFGSDREGGS
jgi:chorismate synthase